MRHLIVVNVDDKRWRRIRIYWENRGVVAERFPGTFWPGQKTLSIDDTHRRLCEKALAEKWDETNVVVYDDTIFPDGIPEHKGQLTIYGAHCVGHLGPHAFSATAAMWKKLAKVWTGPELRDGKPYKVCHQWQELAVTGVLLDATARR